MFPNDTLKVMNAGDWVFVYHGKLNQDRLVQFLGGEDKVKFDKFERGIVKCERGEFYFSPGTVFVKVDGRNYIGVGIK